MALMLYAKYGRIGVEVLESGFCDMGLGKDDHLSSSQSNYLGAIAVMQFINISK